MTDFEVLCPQHGAPLLQGKTQACSSNEPCHWNWRKGKTATDGYLWGLLFKPIWTWSDPKCPKHDLLMYIKEWSGLKGDWVWQCPDCSETERGSWRFVR